jgi:hypothetical protein
MPPAQGLIMHIARDHGAGQKHNVFLDVLHLLIEEHQIS